MNFEKEVEYEQIVLVNKAVIMSKSKSDWGKGNKNMQIKIYGIYTQ